ncbi:MAG: hypothetical protein A2X46_05215 [Lentisphaerae bacterium GWF2_57_35]|nr:MAG: hypothetical protein A2X46_05215 [Lentisphaerae bacterium GWF2_57_35]
MNQLPSCTELSWDSTFFGCKIAQVHAVLRTNEEVRSIIDWCQHREVECLYYRCPVAALDSLREVPKHGFQICDIRMTYHHDLRSRLDNGQKPCLMRPAVEGDLHALKALAKCSHHNTRFFKDGNFSHSLCEHFYEVWIEQCFHSPQGYVWIAEESGVLNGYVACSVDSDFKGHIDLIAVDSKVRCRGIGNQLILRALHYFGTKNAAYAAVVTQADNLAAQRLYQRNGFVLASVELWFHKWFDVQK